MDPDPIVRYLNPKTLPKTNFDKILDGLVVTSLPIFSTALAIKVVFRGRRI